MATMEATIVLNEKAPKHGEVLEGEQWKELVKEVKARKTGHGTLYRIFEELEAGVELKESDLLKPLDEEKAKRKERKKGRKKCPKAVACECCWTCPDCGAKLLAYTKVHFTRSKKCAKIQVRLPE